MKGASAKSRIALGQACLLVSLLLVASYAGLFPDRNGAIREGRTALAEAIAANTSAFISQADLSRLEADLKLVVERNADILSAAVRRQSDGSVMMIGDHERHWSKLEGEFSTDSQLIVPIWTGDKKWGQVELRFRPLVASGWLRVVTDPLAQFIGFIALSSFAVFYFYLGKMLKQLDPSQAIPGRVRSALDTMAEGLLVLDNKEHIVLANEAFASIVGKTPDELLGQRASAFPWAKSNDESGSEEVYPWVTALQEGTPQKNVLIRLQEDDAKQSTFLVNCSPVLGDGNKAGGVLISFDDVTLLEEKEAELRKSKDEAEAANRAKSEFLANMSHEIRTPMNAILGFTEILKRGYGKNERDVKKYLSTISSSGTHLLGLINDILDLSKVEAGHLEVERIGCAPHKIVQETMQVLVAKAQEKGLRLAFEPDGPIPETIVSDPARIRQIITNLVGNAIKFTERGQVTVVTRLLEVGQESLLAIDVIDTGIGMAKEKLDAVFNPFEQADSSITRRFGGTGLGLAISRKFAQLLGGDITVRSELGKGSAFTATLATGSLEGVRLLQPDEVLITDQEANAAVQLRWEFPSARVLVVDDGNENRELVTLVLEEAGLHVEGAENGQVAVDKACAEAFDVILMDVQMPVMDGYTATGLLRQRGMTTPIIALTAHAMKGYEQKCLDAGFSGYMTKPVDIDGLMKLLADLLGGQCVEHVESETLPLKPVEVEPQLSGGSTVAGPPIVSRLPASNPRFRPLIERFVRRLDEQLERMFSARRSGNYNDLADLAHWLKGAGGTVGFDVFTEPAKNLEQVAKARREDQIDEILEELTQLVKRIVVDDRTHVPQTPPVKSEMNLSEPSPAVVSRLHATNPRIQSIIHKFIVRMGEQLQAMERAREQGDFEELANLAHWLKGAGGTVGFDALTGPAQDLEQFAKQRQEEQITETMAVLRDLANRIEVPETRTVSRATASAAP